ncbi:MAG: acetyl-CoA carboxylase biotin carboxyl carrier protein subunit [Spirochaetae bacterium HGW-Spirochaetae-7]|jgi:glutaconyl-CoA decarboxylase|nr:MAG: acetyl-CoA carboxylase biotin carboxyl carrier protein subunit [Spirochaetae bacterium HGW-Spirochaetae-7]
MFKKYKVTVNGQSYDVGVEDVGSAVGPAAAPVAQASASAPVAPAAAAPAASGGAVTIKAPMPGTVLSLKVATGNPVKRGDVLMILEAMKMENEISAPSDGVVAAIRVQAGSTVNTGDPMIDLA